MANTETIDTGDSLPAPAPGALPRKRTLPVFTYGLVVLLAAVYIGELIASPGASFLTGPSPQMLTVLGGTMRPLVQGGDYWRLLTAPLLHAGLMHVGFNCLALLIVGSQLEPYVGSRWMAATFAVSAIGGACASMLANPPNVVGVGASGGIVGLFVVAVFVAIRQPDRVVQSRMIRTTVGTLIPTLIPQLSHSNTAGGGLVDYADHIGGAIVGAVMGAFVLALLPYRVAQRTAGIVGAAFFLGALVSAWPVIAGVEEYRSVSLDWPATGTDWRADIEQKVQQYPHDPRILMLYATKLYEKGDKEKAKTELEAALAETRILRDYYDPKLEVTIKAIYAGLLDETGEHDKAKQLFTQLCGADNTDTIKAMLADMKAC